MKRFNMMPNNTSAPNNSYNFSNKYNSILVFLPLIIAVVVIYFMHTNNELNIKSDNIDLLKKYTNLKTKYSKLIELTPNTKDAESLIIKKGELVNKLLGIKNINKEKTNFVDFMLQLKDNISEKVALLKLQKTYSEIEIEGVAQDNQSISSFMEMLEQTKFLQNISLKVSEYIDEYGPYKQKFIINGELI